MLTWPSNGMVLFLSINLSSFTLKYKSFSSSISSKSIRNQCNKLLATLKQQTLLTCEELFTFYQVYKEVERNSGLNLVLMISHSLWNILLFFIMDRPCLWSQWSPGWYKYMGDPPANTNIQLPVINDPVTRCWKTNIYIWWLLTVTLQF